MAWVAGGVKGRATRPPPVRPRPRACRLGVEGGGGAISHSSPPLNSFDCGALVVVCCDSLVVSAVVCGVVSVESIEPNPMVPVQYLVCLVSGRLSGFGSCW